MVYKYRIAFITGENAMDLAELKFVVDTKELETAATKVAELGTAVSKLNKPMQELSKESAKNSKELSKAEEAAAKAALAQLKLEQAQTKSAEATGKSASVLERQNLILEYMAQGNSKGQASILATAKAAGALDDEMLQLNNTLKTQRTLIGGDPFDKSIGLMQKLQNEYKTTNEVSNLFNKNLGLTEKQMIDLAREKERLIALYGIEGKSLSGLSAEYDQLIRKSVEINQANDTRTNSMKAQIKAQNDTAKANAYMATELERVNRLNESGSDITSATNNKLIKFERALKQSGATAAEQVTKLEAYKAALLSTQKAAGNRQVDYLSRALGPQITDIFVGLATGQSPLMVMLQQGGQLRDQFALAGVAGADMGKMLVQASKSMVSSVKDVSVAVGQVLLGAFTGTGKAIVNFGMELTGTNLLLEKAKAQMLTFVGANSILIKGLALMGSVLAGVVGVGLLGAIVGIGALGVAYFKAGQEQDKMTKQLALTGGSLGLTTARAVDMATSMNTVGVSTSAAISVITAMAKEGGFVTKEIEMVTKAALDMQKYASIAIEDTVKAFAKMKEKPVESLFELAKATGMVSPEITKMVIELTNQGKTAEATALAMKTLADVNSQQVARMKEDYTSLSLALIEVGSAIKTFFESNFKDLFFKLSPEKQLKEQIEAIDDILGGKAGAFGVGSLFADKEKYQKQREELTQQLNLIQRAAEAEKARTEQNVKLNSDLEKFNKAQETFATNKDKREKEIAEVTKRNQSLIAAGLITQQQHEEQIAKIREKYKDPKTQQQSFDESIVKQATEAYLTQIGALDHLTKSEVALLKLRTDPKWQGTAQSIKDQVEATYGAAAAAEKLVESEKETEKALELKNRLLGRSDNLGKDYYKTIELINKYAKEGKFGADEVLQLKAALEATTPEAKRLAAAQAENAKVMSGVAAERAAVADQYGGDFKTADEKAAIKSLSDYRKKTAQAEAEYQKQLSDAGVNIGWEEWAMYQQQADAKKALAQDVYDREQYLLSDGFKRSQAQATAMEDLFKGMGDAIVDFALTGKTSFGDMVNSMIVGLIKLEMQMAMTNMYKSMGGMSGIMSAVTSILPFANGGAFDGGVQKFAKGGSFTNSIVDSPTMFKFAKGTGLMGEAGPEAIMPLRRGSDGSLGVAASGGSSGNVSVQVINNSSSQATTNETTDSKGNRKIEVVIGDMTAGEISRSGSASQKSIKSTFGIQPQLIRR
jgi:lambda family phage tail tape measure protein